MVADQGTLAVHNAGTGERGRELGHFGEYINRSPAVVDDTAYIGGDDGSFSAISLDNGTVEWRKDIQVTVDTGVTVGQTAVVAPVIDLSGLIAFEQDGGSRRWEYEIEGGFDTAASTPAVIVNGAIFYTNNESSGVVVLGEPSS